jgi:phosphoribosylaminoimidazole-succinocarboxamide synthase
MELLYKSNFEDLKLIARGKVREIYEVDESLLFVTSDRISAFDVIMKEPVKYKGAILSKISAFWFDKTKHIVKNHFITNEVNDYPEKLKKYAKELDGRSMLVKKCKTIPIECIVRGYIAGSGWKDYCKTGKICGIDIANGLLEFEKLPEPIFTPSTKAEEGHDQNTSLDQASKLIGTEQAEKIKYYAIELYKFASQYLLSKGLVLADTKFEFGVDESGQVILIDEALTPDSSRFWLLEDYAPGKEQVNFDKQVLRDYLESVDWNKTPPPPPLPEIILDKTSEKYITAYNRIVGEFEYK